MSISLLVSITSFPLATFASADIKKSSESFTQNKSRGTWRGGQRSGGSRGRCNQKVTLTALVPEEQDTSQSVPVPYTGGVTISEQPTLWFYISEALDNPSEVTFSFQDQSGQELYNISFTELSAETPGVVGVTLPPTLTLELGQTYHWYFKVKCGSETIYVHGGIERILPDASLANDLISLSPRERSALYWQHGIWYDALTVIATHLNQNSSAERPTEADWQHLLESIGLSNIPAPSR